MSHSFLSPSGWIVLDKPRGMSSTQASSQVRRLAGAAKAGHAGTLDPLATGVLPVALNEATKTIPYGVEGIKQYLFQVRWGEQRTTDDEEGAVIATSSLRPAREAILAILPQFTGVISQQPPLFSALKIAGKRACDLARASDPPVLESLVRQMVAKTRPVTIHDLVLASVETPDHATFLLTCGAGTYVRSLARDMAEVLGTKGYVSFLRRVKVGKFHEKDAISLEKLRELVHKSELHRILLPVGTVLDDIPAVSLAREEAIKIRQGQRISARYLSPSSSLVALWFEDKVLALAREWEGCFYPKRVFKIDI